MIGIVLVREDCFLVYCDKNSEIKKKSVDCPSTTRPDTSTVTDIFTTLPDDNDDTTTPFVVTTTEIVEKHCEWNHLQFTPGQFIGTVTSDGICFMVYCDENSEIVNKTVECTSTTQPEVTTTEVVTITPRQVTPSVCEWKNFVYAPGDVIGIVVVESGCVLVYCDLDSNIANKTVNCPTTASSTSTPSIDTTEPTKYCQYNNFQYMPGQEVGTVEFQGTCYLVYCGSNSKISKKEVQCESPVNTTTTPVDVDTTTPIVTTKPKQCVYNQFVYEAGQMIGIVLVREDCFLVYCDKNSEIKKKSVDCPSTTRPDTSTVTDIFTTLPDDNVDTTTPFVATTTEIVEKHCEWNHLQFTPGQFIGTVNSDGICFMVYCDENSEIVNKTVECT